MVNFRSYLIPSKEWRVRISSLFSFVIFDYILTGVYCDEFSKEGNYILRSFMIQFNSVILGLTIFTIIFYVPIYTIFSYFSNHVHLKRRGIIELVLHYKRPLFDIVLGLGVAARHFEGGMSWILPLSNKIWLALGFVVYLSIVYIRSLPQ